MRRSAWPPTSSWGSWPVTKSPPQPGRQPGRLGALCAWWQSPWSWCSGAGIGVHRLYLRARGRGPRHRRRHRRRAPQPSGHTPACRRGKDRGLRRHHRLGRFGGREGPTAQISAGFGSLLSGCWTCRPRTAASQSRWGSARALAPYSAPRSEGRCWRPRSSTGTTSSTRPSCPVPSPRSSPTPSSGRSSVTARCSLSPELRLPARATGLVRRHRGPGRGHRPFVLQVLYGVARLAARLPFSRKLRPAMGALLTGLIALWLPRCWARVTDGCKRASRPTLATCLCMSSSRSPSPAWRRRTSPLAAGARAACSGRDGDRCVQRAGRVAPARALRPRCRPQPGPVRGGGHDGRVRGISRAPSP